MDEFGLRNKWGGDQGSEGACDEDDDTFQRAAKRETMSEYDHYATVVKRENFVSLFLANYEADKFIVTHLYGALD